METFAFCAGVVTIALGIFLIVEYYIDVSAGIIIIIFGVFYILGGIASIIVRKRKNQ